MPEITIEAKLARKHTMENVADAVAYLLVKISPDSSVEYGRSVNSMAFVIDTSRSMKGKKIASAVEAVKIAVANMNPEDWLTVMTFSDDTRLIFPPGPVGDKINAFHSLETIRIQSGTRMFLGMNAAIREMAAFQSAGGTKRMLLLTDGETEGEERCHELAQKAKEQGIVIGAFGTGDRYNEVLLSELAEKTLGQFSHLAVPEQIETSFKAEVESAKASVISNVRFSVNLAKEVRLESISRIFPNTVRLDPEYDPEGRIASVQGGSLRKDDITAYGLQLRLPARSAGRVRIAQVYVSYSIPSLQIEDRVEKRDIIVEYSGNRDLCGVVDREVVAYFNQINAQTLVEKAVRETKAGNLAGATETLNQAKALTHKIGNISLTQSIEEVSQELRTQGTISSEGIKTVIAGSRHTVRVDEEPGISQAGGPTP